MFASTFANQYKEYLVLSVIPGLSGLTLEPVNSCSDTAVSVLGPLRSKCGAGLHLAQEV